MTPVELIDRYCSAWNAPTPDQRRSLLAPIWDPAATYTDPTADALPLEALLVHIEGVRERRPGYLLERTSGLDVHHGWARFAWQVRLAGGRVMPEGLDLVRLSADGTRLCEVIGFFGPLPSR